MRLSTIGLILSPVLGFILAVAFKPVAAKQSQIPNRQAWLEQRWARVSACMDSAIKIKEIPDGTLAKIHWRIVSSRAIDSIDAAKRPEDARSRILGLYDSDTIWLDSTYADTAWLVEHEMAHHRIHHRKIKHDDMVFHDNTGYAGHYIDGDHPWIPFVFPCKLMYFQHGGVIGG